MEHHREPRDHKDHKERRKHRREIFNFKIEVMSENQKNVFKCASFDISEGGIRIVTNAKIENKNVVVQINRQKIGAKIVHVEKRKSSVMNDIAYYYGLEFVHPIKSTQKKDLVLLSQKAGFR